MTQSLHPAAQQGFGSGASLYQQVRPSYPQEVDTFLQDQLKVLPNSHIVDLGSGTGKFLPHLLKLTTQLTAVEPIASMLTELRQLYPQVATVQARSEQLPLPAQCADLVSCAQSFHWFANLQSLKEIHRILKPQAHLLLIWNQRDISVNWVNALAEMILPFEGDTPRFHNQDWRQVFADTDLFQLCHEQQFHHRHVGTVEQVVSKRLLSTSFIAAMPAAQQQQLKTQFEQLILEYTGLHAQDTIEFPYCTHVFIYQKIG
ncbi:MULTISPECIES: class I SAM-dependent methyltransferase [Acinetobacter]|jgi:SAM-dependent methyltransferase|uniref:class I SAM-dependent methyltransferase n=1 Tax=Acinetobacter TaxID=469 RepID=UPI0014489C6E|nr:MULTISPECIES: class I SAM-dependent methyltransferase [Acinetobacter]MDV2483654.1 class I SAM-dependent methyltransferase [Acinetobacter towneri]MEB6565583.1 class I SAM-dependent methyltransferase [Acinetobacter towneri]NLN58849.1 class I SAM-dependent methyltransferase [Gammaproteobacteria bacterium]